MAVTDKSTRLAQLFRCWAVPITDRAAIAGGKVSPGLVAARFKALAISLPPLALSGLWAAGLLYTAQASTQRMQVAPAGNEYSSASAMPRIMPPAAL